MLGTLGVVLQLTPTTHIAGSSALPDPFGWSLDLLGGPGDDAGVTIASGDYAVLDRLHDVIGRMRDERDTYLAQHDDGVAWKFTGPRRLELVDAAGDPA